MTSEDHQEKMRDSYGRRILCVCCEVVASSFRDPLMSDTGPACRMMQVNDIAVLFSQAQQQQS